MHVPSMFALSSLPRTLAMSLLALLGCVATAFAEDDWYQIEVVIFDQAGGPGSDNHQLGLKLGYPDNWRQLTDPNAPPNPWFDDEVDEQAVPPPASDQTSSPAATHEEQPYTLLPSSERRLNGDARSLERSAAYRVLYHEAWRQPLSSRAGSAWVLVRGGEQYGDHRELEGALRIYLQRAVFAQARLWQARFRDAVSNWVDDESPAEPLVLPAWPARFGGETPLFERLARESSHNRNDIAWSNPVAGNRLPEQHAGSSTGPVQVDHLASLEQTQRLELGTTLYLDHPEMGVLVHVTRYQRDADESEADEPAHPDDSI